MAKVRIGNVDMDVHSNLMIFFGFVKAIEKHELHRRIALLLLSLAGNRTQLIMLAFMLTTAFLSMWISNTATAALMVCYS